MEPSLFLFRSKSIWSTKQNLNKPMVQFIFLEMTSATIIMKKSLLPDLISAFNILTMRSSKQPQCNIQGPTPGL